MHGAGDGLRTLCRRFVALTTDDVLSADVLNIRCTRLVVLPVSVVLSACDVLSTDVVLLSDVMLFSIAQGMSRRQPNVVGFLPSD